MTDMEKRWGVADNFFFLLKYNIIEINCEVQRGIQISKLC